MQKKLFVIGFNKTGTRSLHNLFSESGYNSVHWQEGELAIKIDENIKRGKDPLSGYEEYDVFSDMENVYCEPLIEAYRYFRHLYEHHPEALFLLNYRDIDDWLQSRSTHSLRRDNKYVQSYKRYPGVSSDEEVIHHWRRSYYRHHANVLDFFADKPGSLVLFNLDRDKAEDLADRLSPDFQLDPSKFQHVGKSNRDKEPLSTKDRLVKNLRLPKLLRPPFNLAWS